MVTTKIGNLLDAKGIIVHGCNAQGVMGSGVALQIKNKWSDAYKSYKQAIQDWGDQKICPLGRVVFHKVRDDLWIINAITQEYYGRDKSKVYVDYEAVRTAFHTINWYFHDKGLPINFPKIGCGLANGDWDVVSKIIDEELDDRLEKVLWIQ